MNKAQARRVAYRIASNWITSNVEAGAWITACESRGIMNEQDQDRVAKALEDIAESLDYRAEATRLSFPR